MRGWLIFGLIAALPVIAIIGLWFGAPALVAGQIESTLRDAGFEVARVDVEGFGWRKIEVVRVEGRTRKAQFEARGSWFSYRLWGLLRGQAESLTVGQLRLSYEALELPEWEDIQREFPFLVEERDPEEAPFANRIEVEEGEVRVRVGDTDVALTFAARAQASVAGRWEGGITIEGAALEAVVDFEIDTGADAGRFEMRDGRFDHEMVRWTGVGMLVFEADLKRERGWIKVRELSVELEQIQSWVAAVIGPETMDQWEVMGETLFIEGGGEWTQRRFEWEVTGELDFGQVLGPRLLVAANGVSLHSMGALTWGEATWDLQFEADATAAQYTHDDIQLQDVEATWRGPPWRGHLTYEGLLDPQRLLIVGDYHIELEDGDWKVEGDSDIDLTQPLD